MAANPATIQRDEEISKFVAAVRSTNSIWKSLDIRSIFVRFEDEWHNWVTRCVLDSRDPLEVPLLHSLPKTADLICSQEICGAGDLAGLIGELQVGAFQLRGQR